MGLSEYVEREKTHSDSKEALLEMITTQEDLIQTQKEAILNLLNETMEQEAIIRELMRGHVD